MLFARKKCYKCSTLVLMYFIKANKTIKTDGERISEKYYFVKSKGVHFISQCLFTRQRTQQLKIIRLFLYIMRKITQF